MTVSTNVVPTFLQNREAIGRPVDDEVILYCEAMDDLNYWCKPGRLALVALFSQSIHHFNVFLFHWTSQVVCSF